MPTSPPPAEELIRYHKDAGTRIATITFDRPEYLNAPTIAARLRYADLLHRAGIDDDVKVLVIRGAGEDLGSGADLTEVMDVQSSADASRRLAEYRIGADEVTFPPEGSFRRGATLSQWYANPTSGIRGLQDFKKISILEVKGYLVFTGRAFTAAEMYDCNFLNSVVPGEELESEVEKYALACARNRPTDTVFMQKVFFEIMKQFQGEYMGSMLSCFFESMGGSVRPDSDDDFLLSEAMERGLGDAVNDNDNKFPPEWRLSKKAREKFPGKKSPKRTPKNTDSGTKSGRKRER